MSNPDITETINRFYNLYGNNPKGAPVTRFRSWEWCHNYFIEHKDNPSAEEKDFMALHLAFYLASWGMYRGSTYLLQRDYKAHTNAVENILNNEYQLLWNFDSTQSDINKAKELLFGNDGNGGIYHKIKDSYNEYYGSDDDASETLVTKILLGTFGCVPAFDRFLKSGISWYQKNNSAKIGNYTLTQSIQDKRHETFSALCQFASDKKTELDSLLDSLNIKYPPMKLVDMYFWELGYELYLAKELVDDKNSDNKKAKLRECAYNLELCDINDDFNTANNKIMKQFPTTNNRLTRYPHGQH